MEASHHFVTIVRISLLDTQPISKSTLICLKIKILFEYHSEIEIENRYLAHRIQQPIFKRQVLNLQQSDQIVFF